ncbi:MAG: DUF3300 domain-containing protein [Candidatus Sumerlaeia bacterium]
MQRYWVLSLFMACSAAMAAGSTPAPQDIVTTSSGMAPEAAPAPPPADQAAAAPMSQRQLDELVGPIALYPDVLLAQVLAASTYPLDVVEADRWLKAHNNDATGIDRQSWDPSVRAVARYPQVIAMMSQNLAWLRRLGDAVMNQQPGVMDAVQRSRAMAQQAGALKTDQAQKVEESDNVIVIEPANPQVIYVPVYEPQSVYYGPSDYAYPYGYYDDYYDLPIRYYPPVYSGGWLDMDCDWSGRSLYYGGWGFRHGYCDDDDFYKRHHRSRGRDFYGSDHRGRDFDRYVNRWQHRGGTYAYASGNWRGSSPTRSADPARISRELGGRGGVDAGDRVRFNRNPRGGAVDRSQSFVRDPRAGRDSRFAARGITGRQDAGARTGRRISSPPSERNYVSRSRIPTQNASLIRSGDYGANILRSRIYTRERGRAPEGIRQFGIRPNTAYRGSGTEWNIGGGGRSLLRQNPVGRGRGTGGLRNRDTFVGPRGPVYGATRGGGARGSYSAPYLGGYSSSGPVIRGGAQTRGTMSLRGGVATGGRNFGRSPGGR